MSDRPTNHTADMVRIFMALQKASGGRLTEFPDEYPASEIADMVCRYIAEKEAPTEKCAAGPSEGAKQTWAVEPMLQFFEYAHLPPHLANVSQPFGDLACKLVAALPRNPERTVALRKLLEAKDCAVRALLFKDPQARAPAPLAKDEGVVLSAVAFNPGEQVVMRGTTVPVMEVVSQAGDMVLCLWTSGSIIRKEPFEAAGLRLARKDDGCNGERG